MRGARGAFVSLLACNSASLKRAVFNDTLPVISIALPDLMGIVQQNVLCVHRTPQCQLLDELGVQLEVGQGPAFPFGGLNIHKNSWFLRVCAFGCLHSCICVLHFSVALGFLL